MNNDLENIKSRIDIVELIGQYLKLEKAGTNWKAVCPFHNEKSPSFMVSEEKQIFHCFGCQKGGDIFTFIMEMEGLEFREALEFLAEKAGVELQKFEKNPERKKERDRSFEILNLATKFFEHQLWNGDLGKRALEYLRDRGLGEKTIKEFRLGYAPPGWENILKFLLGRGYSEKEIEKTGLLVKKDKGGFYDRFRSRIMFPISDSQGRVVGYSARVTPGQDESQAKYINTPETEVYHKSKVLFGLDKAKTSIKQNDWVLLVEGNMDVIAASQAGIQNVVAVSGTALTEEQIKIIKRYTRNIKMFFDMDEAGEQATRKSLKLCFKEGLEPSIVSLPEGKDAADVVKDNPEKLKEAIENSKEAFSYLLERDLHRFNVDEARGKRMIAENFLEMLAFLESDLEKNHWIKNLAREINTEESILTEMLKGASLKGSGYGKEKAILTPEKAERTESDVVIERILGLAFAYEDVWKKAIEAKDELKIFVPENFRETFFDSENHSCDFNKFLNLLSDQNDREKADKIYAEEKYFLNLDGELEEKNIPDPLVEFEKYFNKLRIGIKKREFEKVAEEISFAHRNGDKEKEDFLKHKLQEINSDLAKLI